MTFQSAAQQLMVPNTDMSGAFNQGAQTAEAVQNSELARAKQGMEMIASAAYGVLGGRLDGQADPAQWEETLNYFQARGIPVDSLRGKPQMANTIARSSLDVLRSAHDDQTFQLALKKFEQEVAQGGNYGLTPIYGTDAEGNPSMVQLSSNGGARQVQMPDGFQVSKEPIRIDAGTHTILLDPITRQQIGMVPKNNEEAAFLEGFGTASGKAAAERIAQLPQVLAQADNMLGTIDGILNDPALDASTGWLSWMQNLPGTDQYRFGQRALQLQGQAFLQAFESLKGGGQITEVEGVKATQAIGRLSTAQSPEDYRAALEELKGLINAAKERAQQRAGTGLPSPAPVSGGQQVVPFEDYFD